MDRRELKPCPFCGCAMRLDYNSTREYCGPEGSHNPGCLIGSIDFIDFADVWHAISVWNKRALPKPEESETDDAHINSELVGMIRASAKRVFGGNCTFADDDLARLERAATPKPEGSEAALERAMREFQGACAIEKGLEAGKLRNAIAKILEERPIELAVLDPVHKANEILSFVETWIADRLSHHTETAEAEGRVRCSKCGNPDMVTCDCGLPG